MCPTSAVGRGPASEWEPGSRVPSSLLVSRCPSVGGVTTAHTGVFLSLQALNLGLAVSASARGQALTGLLRVRPGKGRRTWGHEGLVGAQVLRGFVCHAQDAPQRPLSAFAPCSL